MQDNLEHMTIGLLQHIETLEHIRILLHMTTEVLQHMTTEVLQLIRIDNQEHMTIGHHLLIKVDNH